MDELIAEQIRYYRERAFEYDETSRPEGDPFAPINDLAMDALRALGPADVAIELGAGTGAITGVLAELARRVIAVDSSPEMLALNHAKLAASNVEYAVADVFEWRPSVRADLVLFAFLLSHIPEARFDAFWHTVGQMLRPGGHVFLYDETAHDLWREEAYEVPGGEVVARTLTDGRRFRIVKVLWDAEDLVARLDSIGWAAHLERHDPFFWGVIQPAP